MFRPITLSRPIARTRSGLLLVALLAASLIGCSNGGSGGGGPVPFTTTAEVEPNDDPSEATALTPGKFVHGDLVVPGDIDQWSFTGTAGTVVRIETRAYILDQATWESTCAQLRIELLDPADEPIYTHVGMNERDTDMPAVVIDEPGEHRIVVSCVDPMVAGGAYALRYSLLPGAALQHEVEAIGAGGENETIATAEPIVPGRVWGYLLDGDLDHFVFTVAQPSIIEFEVSAFRNGTYGMELSSYDSYLRLFDVPTMSNLASRDDAYYFDSGMRYVVTDPNDYVIQVDSWTADSDSGEYLLDFTSRPLPALSDIGALTPMDAVPLPIGVTTREMVTMGSNEFFLIDGRAGDLLDISIWSGFSFQGQTTIVMASLLAPDGTTPVPVTQDDWGLSAYLREDGFHALEIASTAPDSEFALQPERIRVSTRETEPNDLTEDAGTIARGLAVSGEIPSNIDVDRYTFTALAGEMVDFEVFCATGLGVVSSALPRFTSELLAGIRILDSDGVEVASSSSPSSCTGPQHPTNVRAAFELAYIAPAVGTYTLEVFEAAPAGGSNNPYLVRWVTGP